MSESAPSVSSTPSLRPDESASATRPDAKVTMSRDWRVMALSSLRSGTSAAWSWMERLIMPSPPPPPWRWPFSAAEASRVAKNWAQTASSTSCPWKKADTASLASSSLGSSRRMDRMYSDVSSSRCAERDGVEASALVRIDSVWSAMVQMERIRSVGIVGSDRIGEWLRWWCGSRAFLAGTLFTCQQL